MTFLKGEEGAEVEPGALSDDSSWADKSEPSEPLNPETGQDERTGRMMLSNSVLRPIPIGLKQAIATGLQQGSM